MSEALKVIVEARATVDSDAVSRFGKFMGLRQWGNTPHVELFSDAPGNDGFEKIVIYEEDFSAVQELALELSKIAAARLNKGTDDADLQDRAETKESNNGRGAGNKGKGNSALTR